MLDAVDDAAASFYARHLFSVPGNPRRLVQKLSTVASALGVTWP